MKDKAVRVAARGGRREARTQAELDRHLAEAPAEWVRLVGDGRFMARDSAHVVARGSAHVVARDSAHVEAWGSARVEAWGSARVEAGGSAHVVARDSAHVEAWDSARVVARESAHVVARDSAHVEAARYVSVDVWSDTVTVEGSSARVLRIRLATAAEWCDYYGVPAQSDGTVVLYKAVDDEYRSSRGMRYVPGTTPAAPDWDGGAAECGGGLHFAPTPHHARRFRHDATRYVACPVWLAEIVVHHPALYPDKVKAPRVAAPCWEVTLDGAPVAAPTEAA